MPKYFTTFIIGAALFAAGRNGRFDDETSITLSALGVFTMLVLTPIVAFKR